MSVLKNIFDNACSASAIYCRFLLLAFTEGAIMHFQFYAKFQTAFDSCRIMPTVELYYNGWAGQRGRKLDCTVLTIRRVE